MFAYIVRCNFSEPAKEQFWNDWYSGPKIGQMLSKPYFRSTQRFRRSDGTGRNYLALWIIESPEAFTTKEYTSDWGFFEWKPYIVDWSRDLFDGAKIVEDSFSVSPQGALHVVSFDGMGKEETAAAQKAFAFIHPNMAWLAITGLDKHTEMIGLLPVSELPQSWRPSNAATGAQEALYLPISDFHRASDFHKAL
ncbi:MAG TPA: hypothetical protein VNQ56_16840 [Pseudolabrys sp.]|nr:hypothetical protein [Pseudolabrys sp.]